MNTQPNYSISIPVRLPDESRLEGYKPADDPSAAHTAHFKCGTPRPDATHVPHLVQARHFSQNGNVPMMMINPPHLIFGWAGTEPNISRLSPLLPPTLRQLPINPAATRQKRAKMPSRHAPADEKLIDSLPMGAITAFRSSIYLLTYAASNAHLFITNDWIDAEQLCQFLKRVPDPDRDAPPPESPPARVKLEGDASATRLSASENAIPPVDFPSVITRIPKEGNRFEILSDSDSSDSEENGLYSEHGGHDSGQEISDPRESSPYPPPICRVRHHARPPDSGTQFSVPPSPSTSPPRLSLIPASSPISPTPEPVTAHVDQVSATGSKKRKSRDDPVNVVTSP
ncbi:hypothetical protein FB451DRAFT_1164437 [Mycena latifolia]|nr:hypothetical protein FB451DRAFT_1164437 [Mycena latifolia]